MKSDFTLEHLPTLDRIVLDTLTLYRNIEVLPTIDLSQIATPLVVGSGNGYYTGRILFRDVGAFFATESEVHRKLEHLTNVTDVVVISASGEKHAPIILESAKTHSKNTLLISSSHESRGRSIADHSIIMPKIREPYTYNTSTYFGYMLAGESDISLEKLEQFITETLAPSIEKIDWNAYSSFALVIPDEFVLIREMFEVKFIELFGRKVARDVFSYEQMKHAITVVPDDGELFVCFGNESGIQYGKNQVHLPIFDRMSYAAMMLVGYYTIGTIQKAFPPYFMEHINAYCDFAREKFGFQVSPIVEK